MKLLGCLFCLSSLFFLNDAQAMGKNTKKKNSAQKITQRKQVIELASFPNRYIEIPGEEESASGARKKRFVYEYGKNISNGVISKLVSTNKFVIVLPDPEQGSSSGIESQSLALKAAKDEEIGSDPIHLEDSPLSVVKIRGEVKELWFVTGERADRSFYGFREGFVTPYNDGRSPEGKNEFLSPLGRTFSDYGDLHVGKDLGSAINFDVLWFGAGLKYSKYAAAIGVEFELQNMLTGEVKRYSERFEKNGFYFELVGQYLNYMGGIMVARRDALQKSFDMIKKDIAQRVSDELSAEPQKYPQRFRLYLINKKYYISGGRLNHGVAEGDLFYLRDQPSVKFQVDESFASVASLKVFSEKAIIPNTGSEVIWWDGKTPLPKDEKTGVASMALSSSSAAVPNPDQPWEVRSSVTDNPLSVVKELLSYVQTPLARLWNAFKNLATLPLRISRFASYNQKYYGPNGKNFSTDSRPIVHGRDRYLKVAESQWAYRDIHLTQAWKQWESLTGQSFLKRMGTDLKQAAPLVGILDSGIDYNHQDLRQNIGTDPILKTPGFDFFSGDRRPFDDHAHGTAVASAVAGGAWETVGVWPRAELLPVKIFNPYGYTSSAALYAGVKQAIKAGVKILVIGWTTGVQSQAMKEALQWTKDNHVLVVVAAGEEGLNLSLRPQYPASYVHDFSNLLVVTGHSKDGGSLRSVPVVPLGASPNWGTEVGISAPGVGVRVALPRNGYKTLTLTGISAGFVAGTAALLFDYLAFTRCGATAEEQLALVKAALVGDGGWGSQPPSPTSVTTNTGIYRLSVYHSLMRLVEMCRK